MLCCEVVGVEISNSKPHSAFWWSWQSTWQVEKHPLIWSWPCLVWHSLLLPVTVTCIRRWADFRSAGLGAVCGCVCVCADGRPLGMQPHILRRGSRGQGSKPEPSSMCLEAYGDVKWTQAQAVCFKAVYAINAAAEMVGVCGNGGGGIWWVFESVYVHGRECYVCLVPSCCSLHHEEVQLARATNTHTHTRV